MNDDELRTILKTDPKVRRRRDGVIEILVSEEIVPEKPSVCPECGESYARRSLHGKENGDSGHALFIHGSGSFLSDKCRVDDYWTPKQVAYVHLDRARRVMA